MTGRGYAALSFLRGVLYDVRGAIILKHNPQKACLYTRKRLASGADCAKYVPPARMNLKRDIFFTGINAYYAASAFRYVPQAHWNFRSQNYPMKNTVVWCKDKSVLQVQAVA